MFHQKCRKVEFVPICERPGALVTKLLKLILKLKQRKYLVFTKKIISFYSENMNKLSIFNT